MGEAEKNSKFYNWSPSVYGLFFSYKKFYFYTKHFFQFLMNDAVTNEIILIEEDSDETHLVSLQN